VWAKLDDAFAILAKKLNLHDIRPLPAVLPAGDVFEIPYNANGWKDDSVRMTLDLRHVCRAQSTVYVLMINSSLLGFQDHHSS
jgi:hypothetical protein